MAICFWYQIIVLRLVSVVRMVTVLDECNTEEQCSVVHSLWEEGLNTKNIHEEMFPVYGSKCLSHNTVHNGVEKFSQE
jgi:hypothetical protein